MSIKRHWALPILFVVILSGCQTLETVKPAGMSLTQPEIQSIQVASIVVKSRSSVADTRIASALQSRLEEVMPLCATGTQPYDMHVRVDGFKEQSGAATILLGDSINLSALVEFREPGTNKLVGEYYNSAFKMSGGLIGALALSDAHNQLPKRYALDLCSQLFKRPVPDSYDFDGEKMKNIAPT